MMVAMRTYLAAAVLAGALAVGAGSEARRADTAAEATTQPAASDSDKGGRNADEMLIESIDPASVPITPPTRVKTPGNAKSALLPSGTAVIDRLCRIEKDPTGKWQTIKDRRVGRLYLLPCELLETIEDIRADDPDATFYLSGEVHRYRGGYYMLIRRAMRAQPKAATAPAEPVKPAPPKQTPTSRSRPVRKTTTTKPSTAPDFSEPDRAVSTRPAGPTSRPAPDKNKGVSADDIAAELLGQTPSRPIIPVIKPELPKTATAPSGARPGEPLRAGPGKTAIHRLVRLLPRTKSQRWYRLAFESDNTLREPPMRILPNLHLERMEIISGNGTAFGVIFYISGEVLRYRGNDYLLLRAAKIKRNLDQF